MNCNANANFSVPNKPSYTTVSSTLNQRLEKIMRELFSYPGNCSPHPFLVFGPPY